MSEEPEVTIESNDVKAQGFAQQVVGDNVQFGPGVALTVSAEGNISLERAAAVTVRAEEDASLTNGGAAAIVAGGDMEVINGGAQVLVAGGDVQISNGGAQYVIAGDSVTASKAFIGIAITDKLNLSEDSRVLLYTPRAIAFGAAFGVFFGFISLVFRGRRRK